MVDRLVLEHRRAARVLQVAHRAALVAGPGADDRGRDAGGPPGRPRPRRPRARRVGRERRTNVNAVRISARRSGALNEPRRSCSRGAGEPLRLGQELVTRRLAFDGELRAACPACGRATARPALPSTSTTPAPPGCGQTFLRIAGSGRGPRGHGRAAAGRRGRAAARPPSRVARRRPRRPAPTAAARALADPGPLGEVRRRRRAVAAQVAADKSRPPLGRRVPADVLVGARERGLAAGAPRDAQPPVQCLPSPAARGARGGSGSPRTTGAARPAAVAAAARAGRRG